MQAAILPDDRSAWRSPLASVALHLLVIALLILLVPRPQPIREAEVPVSVEIIAPPLRAPPEEAPARPLMPEAGDQAAPRIRSRPDREAALPRLAPPLPSTGSGATPLMRPQKMLSRGALANPRSSAARRELRTLAADERAVQLCGIEAMEQVHAWKGELLPEAVVAYATKSLKIGGGSIVADGGAFYNAGNWYRLRFECDVRADEVVSFAYSVGDLIPRSEWEAYSLPEKADDDD